VGQLDRTDAAARKRIDVQLTEVFFETADHDRLELGLVDVDTAGEALLVQDLEQGGEAVAVAVVRRGRQKQAILEAGATSRMTSVIFESMP